MKTNIRLLYITDIYLFIYLFIYLQQLGFHSVTVVGRFVQK